MKRINGIFISLIGMLALSMSLMAQDVATVTDGVPETNYEDLFASLAAIVAGVPVIVEAIRGFWKSMPGWVQWRSTGYWASGFACSAGGRTWASLPTSTGRLP